MLILIRRCVSLNVVIVNCTAKVHQIRWNQLKFNCFLNGKLLQLCLRDAKRILSKLSIKHNMEKESLI